ncbi:DUF1223 domain-containing protein [Aquimarina sp. 2304DJ70-9]|uniref:DUF1223 domain-containing protein n=1 Tax=Aquimarina penaris TaxID=3231044 RepID=UPI003462882A
MQKKLLLLLTCVLSISIYAQENNTSAIVLELFTSQGCSSCPPADKLLDEVREQYKNQNVFVLSYHVDYWNRLGWKDPFSAKAYSEYQREYGVQFRSRSIYTPQLVVNGSEHFTGSNRYKTDSALKKYAKSKTRNTITLSNIKRKEKQVHLGYEVEGDTFDRVTLALVISERITTIPRGENRNRTLKNTNIVVNRIVKRENSGRVSINIPGWVSKKDKLSIIAYTQDDVLKTTGATREEI